jgi:hypothetical protein
MKKFPQGKDVGTFRKKAGVYLLMGCVNTNRWPGLRSTAAPARAPYLTIGNGSSA